MKQYLKLYIFKLLQRKFRNYSGYWNHHVCLSVFSVYLSPCLSFCLPALCLSFCLHVPLSVISVYLSLSISCLVVYKTKDQTRVQRLSIILRPCSSPLRSADLRSHILIICVTHNPRNMTVSQVEAAYRLQRLPITRLCARAQAQARS